MNCIKLEMFRLYFKWIDKCNGMHTCLELESPRNYSFDWLRNYSSRFPSSHPLNETIYVLIFRIFLLPFSPPIGPSGHRFNAAFKSLYFCPLHTYPTSLWIDFSEHVYRSSSFAFDRWSFLLGSKAELRTCALFVVWTTTSESVS